MFEVKRKRAERSDSDGAKYFFEAERTKGRGGGLETKEWKKRGI